MMHSTFHSVLIFTVCAFFDIIYTTHIQTAFQYVMYGQDSAETRLMTNSFLLLSIIVYMHGNNMAIPSATYLLIHDLMELITY